jgi:hypothetical protein
MMRCFCASLPGAAKVNATSFRYVFGVVLLAAANASDAAGALPSACAAAMAENMPNWRPIDPPHDAAVWARAHGVNATVASGDFDGNGVKDWAALGAVSGKPKLSVCMNVTRGLKLVVIDEPYCYDIVLKSLAGSRHYNYETARYERIKNDGISVGCFEKAGATYVYHRSGFRRIIDSD